MFRFSTLRRVSLLAVVACMGLLPSVSSAAAGVKVYKQDNSVIGKPGVPQLIYNDATFFDREVKKAWDAARPLIEARMRSELAKARYGSYSLYDIHVRLAQSGTVKLEPYGATAMKISYSLKKNHADFEVSVPNVPGFLEPEFNVSFDATVSIIVTLPRLGAPTKVTWVGAHLDRVSVSGGNITGTIAKFMIDTFTKGGSRELIRRAMTYANAHMQARIDLPLKQVDTLMANVAKLGFNSVSARVQGGQLLVTLIKGRQIILQGAALQGLNAQTLQRK
jgi:hypothetical protein